MLYSIFLLLKGFFKKKKKRKKANCLTGSLYSLNVQKNISNEISPHYVWEKNITRLKEFIHRSPSSLFILPNFLLRKKLSLSLMLVEIKF
jgi:hypothetical protein